MTLAGLSAPYAVTSVGAKAPAKRLGLNGEATMKSELDVKRRLLTPAIVLALVASFGVTVAGADIDPERDAADFGGPHGHHGMRGFRDPARMLERMARHLDLDEAQRQNISNIVEAAGPEIDALRDRARANRAAMRALDPADPDYSAKLANLATENGELVAESTMLFGRVRAEVSRELTAEQREQLAAMAAERHERSRRGRRHAAPESR